MHIILCLDGNIKLVLKILIFLLRLLLLTSIASTSDILRCLLFYDVFLVLYEFYSHMCVFFTWSWIFLNIFLRTKKDSCGNVFCLVYIDIMDCNKAIPIVRCFTFERNVWRNLNLFGHIILETENFGECWILFYQNIDTN